MIPLFQYLYVPVKAGVNSEVNSRSRFISSMLSLSYFRVHVIVTKANVTMSNLINAHVAKPTLWVKGHTMGLTTNPGPGLTSFVNGLEILEIG